jgi:hypothetical protein
VRYCFESAEPLPLARLLMGGLRERFFRTAFDILRDFNILAKTICQATHCVNRAALAV